MNNCILMAEVIQDPQLRYASDNNQTPIAEMTVQFSGLRDEDPPSIVKVVGWGNLAQDIQEKYHQGDRVIIEGRLGMITFDRPEGFKEKRAELTAQRIHLLGAGADVGIVSSTAPVAANLSSSNTPAATPKAAPATPKAADPGRSAAPSRSTTAEPKTPAYPAASNNVPDYDDIPFARPVESKTVTVDGEELIDSAIHCPRVGFEFHKF
ncbi:single-stranded DNA-binding protein [Oculatella sp. LEGE 06141]|uniref:single-stranded DNA-binding protein n=1 Tax=Oculatella sp. LEGE 06141 TaxID=1828648 RepID=UPI00188095D1|nr:single-stranded DNA-binding protein [Oculatella sp. LEGE 06141]MBE9180249.1 single-stranded DNA-binding protein [Oculatella sp. LEGE 06141]